MEIDVELLLKGVSGQVCTDLSSAFFVEIVERGLAVEHKDLAIRLGADCVVGSVEKAIADFLRALASFSVSIKDCQGIFRIGVFYDLDETIVFPLKLSKDVIRGLADLNLSIDLTGYPCSGEDD